MKHVFLEKDSMIIKVNDYFDKIVFIERGCIEVYTEFEGNEFVIERLGPGAVINQKGFFVDDKDSVNMRCC